MRQARRWERQLRLYSALALAVFVSAHLANHAVGLISLAAMEAVREVLAAWWRSAAGSTVLYGALLVHFGLGLLALYRRRTLRMPRWEFSQLLLGLSLLPLLAAHIAATRGGWSLAGRDVNYEAVIGAFFAQPWLLAKQTLVIAIVWGHLLVGLHHWLRLRRGYRRAMPVLYPLAVLLPVLALLGVLRVGAGLPEAPARTGIAQTESDSRDRPAAWTPADVALAAILGLIGATLLARELRSAAERRRGHYRLRHANGRTLSVPRGRSLLEAVRAAGIPHASVCGGRARCTTCRVRISEGLEELPPPDALEAAALARIEAPPNVRLACQTRPQTDLAFTPLLLPDTRAGQRIQGVSGSERDVTALFVDLRGSTGLGEQRLPYDVLFILNRFFAEMAAALDETGGHYAQFNGDGLLALYGLGTGRGRGARGALDGALAMGRRLGELNRSLEEELPAPLRIGIGIHFGTAIVGSMGPPRSPIVSAIGDTINIAARLEALTKDYDCELVVSAAAAQAAGATLDAFPSYRALVRGKQDEVQVYAIARISDLRGTLAVEADE